MPSIADSFSTTNSAATPARSITTVSVVLPGRPLVSALGCPARAACRGRRCRPVAQLGGLVHVVRGQHDGHAVLVQFGDPFVHEQPGLRVKAGGRLVQEHHLRLVHQRAGDHHPLHLAAGHEVDPRLGLLGKAIRARISSALRLRSARPTPW